MRAFLHNRLNPVQISCSCSRRAGLIPKDGRSFNRHVDYFADSLGESAWTMESVFGDIWPKLRRANSRLGLVADQRLVLALRAPGMASAIHQQIARDLVEIVAVRARNLLDRTSATSVMRH
jgi:hypothetical protein